MNHSCLSMTVRKFVLSVSFVVLLCGSLDISAQETGDTRLPSKLKTSLNAYSFNRPLVEGSMDIDSLLEYCAGEGFDAVDITAYYFPGYPEVPADEYLYQVKKKAFLLGLEISGTGIRNDFTDPDVKKRREGIQLIKDWILAAEKLGAPVIRIFTGRKKWEGRYARGQVVDWLVEDIKECVEFGKRHGVVVAIQNHNDFLMNAGQVIEIMERVDSPWFGLILDIGSLREGDVYQQIEQVIPWAVSWQVKEQVYMNGKSEKPDLVRLLRLIKKSGYRGYIPIETLGEGDPGVKVQKFLQELRVALAKVYSD